MYFLWTLFEGVPKLYRDCYEQGVLNQDRQTLLRRIFFDNSPPLRTEAENWFLKEVRGQYVGVLYVHWWRRYRPGMLSLSPITRPANFFPVLAQACCAEYTFRGPS